MGILFENILNYIKNRFYIDTRALALFRIFAGILVIFDVLLRFRNLKLFYTDVGATPRTLMMEPIPSYAFSIHMLTGDSTIMTILFIIQILFAIQLIFGYKTKFAIIATFLLVVSLDLRNVGVTSYADTLFRLLLFWSIFLPLGEKWSLDSKFNNIQPRKHVFSLASVFILLQMVCMYFVNGYHKYDSQDSWWFTAQGLESILNYSRITFFLYEYILSLPSEIIMLLSTSWYILLITSPLLIILQGKYRTIFTLLFILSHIGLGISVRVGAFSFVSILGLLLFIHSGVFDKLESYIYTDTSDDKIIGFEYDNKYIIIIITLIILITGLYMIISTAGYVSPVPDDRDDIPGITMADNTYNTFMLQQPSWSFFTSHRTFDRYSVIIVETDSGKIIDVHKDDTFTGFTEPYKNNAHKTFDTYRHRFYYNSIFRDNYNVLEMNSRQEYYMKYLCNNYRYNNEQIKRVSVYHFHEEYTQDESTIDYQSYNINARIVAYQGCNNNLPGDIIVPKEVLNTEHPNHTRSEIENLVKKDKYHTILNN